MSAADEKSPPPAVFTWLHVSDWHFQARTADNAALEQAIAAISKPVQTFLSNQNENRGNKNPIAVNCLIHSGDVAQSGQAGEYKAAEKVLCKLAKDLGVRRRNVIITPGNHDVLNADAFVPAELLRFKEESDYTNAEMNWLGKTKRLELLLERFNHYHAFKRRCKFPCQEEGPRGWFVKDITLDSTPKRKISVAAVNSALVSTRHDDQSEAKLFLGRLRMKQVIDELKNKHGDAERRILVLHHPLSFLTERDALRCWEIIERTFDVLLCGHKHGQSEILEHLAHIGSFPMIDAGCIHPSRDASKTLKSAGFSLGQIILSGPPQGQIEVTSFAWNESTKSYECNKRTNKEGAPEVRESLSFPLIHPQRPTAYAPGAAYILKGVADAEQLKGQSAHIIENFYRQREDLAHQDAKNPKPELVLETKHFFWHVESRGLFECMTARPEYVPGKESRRVLDKNLDAMAKATAMQTQDSKDLLVAVLGVGNGDKEAEFYGKLKAQRTEKGKDTTLIFIDVNYQMILRAARNHVPDPKGVKFCNADFDSLRAEHLIDAPVLPHTLFLFFGTTFANQREKAFLARLKKLGKDVWLLFDAPLGEHKEAKLKGGYGTDAAKEFKELTLRHFDKRYERKWRMRDSERIEARVVGGLSDVSKNTKTVSNVADSPTFGKIWMGMAHRYDHNDLEAFLASQGWEIKGKWWKGGEQCCYYLIHPNGKSTVPVAPA